MPVRSPRDSHPFSRARSRLLLLSTGREIGACACTSGGQRLRCWVDTDQDADFSDEVTLITSTTVDDDWSAGCVGLFTYGGGAIQQYDDLKIGYDNR